MWRVCGRFLEDACAWLRKFLCVVGELARRPFRVPLSTAETRKPSTAFFQILLLLGFNKLVSIHHWDLNLKWAWTEEREVVWCSSCWCGSWRTWRSYGRDSNFCCGFPVFATQLLNCVRNLDSALQCGFGDCSWSFFTPSSASVGYVIPGSKYLSVITCFICITLVPLWLSIAFSLCAAFLVIFSNMFSGLLSLLLCLLCCFNNHQGFNFSDCFIWFIFKSTYFHKDFKNIFNSLFYF